MTEFLSTDRASQAQYRRDAQLLKEGKKWPLKTGKCNSGWCEGKKPKDRHGNSVQVCGFWQLCPCKCHEQVTMLFKMSDLPRDILLNPEYHRPETTFVLPRFGIDYGRGSALWRDREDDEPITARKPEEFTTTPSGRIQSGGLESMVHAVFQAWLQKPNGIQFIPTFVSASVSAMYDTKAPSTGAVGAVFDRWHQIGFAIQEKKPVRLVSITEAGRKEGLEMMKALAKRKAKFQ